MIIMLYSVCDVVFLKIWNLVYYFNYHKCFRRTYMAHDILSAFATLKFWHKYWQLQPNDKRERNLWMSKIFLTSNLELLLSKERNIGILEWHLIRSVWSRDSLKYITVLNLTVYYSIKPYELTLWGRISRHKRISAASKGFSFFSMHFVLYYWWNVLFVDNILNIPLPSAEIMSHQSLPSTMSIIQQYICIFKLSDGNDNAWCVVSKIFWADSYFQCWWLDVGLEWNPPS